MSGQVLSAVLSIPDGYLEGFKNLKKLYVSINNYYIDNDMDIFMCLIFYTI